MEYEKKRKRHVKYMAQLLPEYIDRLSWSRDKILKEQTKALRSLLIHAKSNSEWHRKRLSDIDPVSVTIEDLDKIPPMSKKELMENWDSIVTDERAKLADANTHISEIKSDKYFLDDYHVNISGGSSGFRGVFLYDWHGWTLSYINLIRGFNKFLNLNDKKEVKPMVSISAYAAGHATSALAQTFSSSLVEIKHIPVTLPLQNIVNELNSIKPDLIHCYPNILSSLCEKARSGELMIDPKAFWCTSEPMLPGDREMTEKTWDATVMNTWSASELNGGTSPCLCGGGAHINEDVCIIEAINRDGSPTPTGSKSERIYITNMFNYVMPLIRYEITDEFEFLPNQCDCGSHYQKIKDVCGRSDESFIYNNDVIAHPLNFYSPLFQTSVVIEFMVFQTKNGAEIDVVTTEDYDINELKKTIESNLSRTGVPNPEVFIKRVEEIKRSETGKLKRFIPLK